MSTVWEEEEQGGGVSEGVTLGQYGDQDPLPGLLATGDTQSEPTAGRMKARPAIIKIL